MPDSYSMVRGADPTGRLERIISRWRLNDPPVFNRLASDGRLYPCTASSIRVGDFVRALVTLDLVRINNDATREDKVEVGLVMTEVSRLFTRTDLDVSLQP